MIQAALRRRFRCAAILVGLFATNLPAQDRTTGNEPVRLSIRVREDAQVRVNGAVMKTTGEAREFASPPADVVREFVSPPLDAGKAHAFTIAATWALNDYTTVTRTRRVSVRPGQKTEVDLRSADPKQPDDIVTKYIPTPPEAVDGMLRLAGVGKGDVVYDLGCGDGRIVIAAVQKFGAKRGVGIDLDPERLKECADNARRAGVSDRVEFRKGDVLKIDDLSEATVVTLYMGEDMNMRLRPILQKSLKPGARIVSHQFSMGDWKPAKVDTSVVRKDDGFRYMLLLWKIPPQRK